MAAQTRVPIKVFYSYAHKDEEMRDELNKHLSILQRQGLITSWYDRGISAGTNWAEEIDTHLQTSQIILLLVSPDFLYSEYCYSKEMMQAIDRHKNGQARVIPVILRPVLWEGAPFGELQALPKDAKPITIWKTLDEAFNNVAKGILRVVEELNSPPLPKTILVPQHEQPARFQDKNSPITSSHTQEDRENVPEIKNLYGRQGELSKLGRWIIIDKCKLVTILGIGGIGKTALAFTLKEQIKDEFEYVFWRSLQNAPPLESLLRSCIQFLSNQQHINLPQDSEEQIGLLLQYISNHRCLLVLDNAETILQADNCGGEYLEEYKRLMQCLGEAKHQSCIIITSREKPKEIARLEGQTAPVRSLVLQGLEKGEGQNLLKEKGLFGSDDDWEHLIHLYSGNPLALKLASEPIIDLFEGNIAAFLEHGTFVEDIYDLIDQQFNRLSALEQGIMYWLAIEREAVFKGDLLEDLPSVSDRELLTSLGVLRRRSMIESGGTALFTVQPVIMEHITCKFIEKIYKEIETEEISLFASHALIKAQAKEYVRESQMRLILKPIIDQLLRKRGSEELEEKFKGMLSNWREKDPRKLLYAAGNALNVLIHLKADLRGYDFSHLLVRQAYLKGIFLNEVNFIHADLTKSVFTDTFSGVVSVAFSPNGKLLAAGTANGEVRLWDAFTGNPLAACHGHTQWVEAVAFSSDSKFLFSGSEEQILRTWDANTGDCQAMFPLHGHTSQIHSIVFSPDRRIVASCGDDQTIRIWDVSTGLYLRSLCGHADKVTSAAFSSDGHLLASSSFDQTIRIWENRTGECIKVIKGYSGSIGFSPRGNILAVGTETLSVLLMEISTERILNTLQGHTKAIGDLAFSSDGAILASGSDDKTVRIWEVDTGRCLHTLQGHVSRIRSVAFNINGTQLASGGNDRTIRLWEVDTGRCLHTLQGHVSRIRSVAFNINGTQLASGGEDYDIQLWEVSTGQPLRILQGHSSWIWSITFSPDGKKVFSCSEDLTIRSWDLSKGSSSQIFTGHEGRIKSIALRPDGKMLASGSDDRTIRLWDINTGRCLHVLRGHDDLVWSVTFSPDGTTLASGSEDGTVRLWDGRTGQHIRTMKDGNSIIWSVSFSPDGKTLVTGSYDCTIRLWNVGTGRCIQKLSGHDHWVRSTAFNPDGNMFASGSDDRTIRLWDSGTSKCVGELTGHSGGVRSLTFSVDGKTLASGSYDGTSKLWDVKTGECLHTLISGRPYEGMNISKATGLTKTQKNALRTLGAIEDARQ